MKVISPFGPKIGKFKLSNLVIKRINAEVDRIVKKKSLYQKLNYSKKLVGQVKQEFQLPKEFIQKFLHKIIETEVKSFIHKVTNQKVKTVKILNFWIVKMLVKIKFANIINIINNKEIIPELIQKECNPKEIFNSVVYFLKNQELMKKQINDCEETLTKIRSKTSSSDEASSVLTKFLIG